MPGSNDVGFVGIFNIGNVRNNTKIQSISSTVYNQSWAGLFNRYAIMHDLDFQSHCSNIFNIPDLTNARINTKIEFVSCLQSEIRKIMQKCVWSWLSKTCNKDGFFSLIPLDSSTRNIPIKDIFTNFGREVKNPPGSGTHPIGRSSWTNHWTLAAEHRNQKHKEPSLTVLNYYGHWTNVWCSTSSSEEWKRFNA